MRPDKLEKQLRERLEALGPARRAELLHVLMLPDLDRANRSARTEPYGGLQVLQLHDGNRR